MNIINNNVSLQTLYQVLPSTNSVIDTIKKLALPVLGTLALSFLPRADAGQLAYLLCMSGCYATLLTPPPFWSFELCARSCEFSRLLPVA